MASQDSIKLVTLGYPGDGTNTYRVYTDNLNGNVMISEQLWFWMF